MATMALIKQSIADTTNCQLSILNFQFSINLPATLNALNNL